MDAECGPVTCWLSSSGRNAPGSRFAPFATPTRTAPPTTSLPMADHCAARSCAIPCDSTESAPDSRSPACIPSCVSGGPHQGVDYAAPRGTPVRATGTGRVSFAGRKGGYGKTIVLSHGNGYTTLYAHLSRYAKGARKGKQVRQGQLIGYVGSTGISTGPHLHYEFRINGVHRDPLTVALPRAAPLDKQEMKRFRRAIGPLVARIDESRRHAAREPGTLTTGAPPVPRTHLRNERRHRRRGYRLIRGDYRLPPPPPRARPSHSATTPEGASGSRRQRTHHPRPHRPPRRRGRPSLRRRGPVRHRESGSRPGRHRRGGQSRPDRTS